MTEVTASLINELRQRTGIGIGKCKEALVEAGGDIETAIANLRKAGMASAVKKEGRAANEGVIATSQTNGTVAIVEVNAETDFVVGNERFQEFSKNIADEVASTTPKSVEDFSSQQFSKDSNLTIEEYRATIVQAIGENIQIRRLFTMNKAQDSTIGLYSHLGGKVVCLVELAGSSDEEELAKSIAMHIAAASPDYVNPDDVPSDVIEHERDIARSQMKGKPENIIEKILDGKLNAFYDDVCLNRQKYIRDDSVTVGELVEKRAKETGKPLAIKSFTRWSVGQTAE